MKIKQNKIKEREIELNSWLNTIYGSTCYSFCLFTNTSDFEFLKLLKKKIEERAFTAFPFGESLETKTKWVYDTLIAFGAKDEDIKKVSLCLVESNFNSLVFPFNGTNPIPFKGNMQQTLLKGHVFELDFDTTK